MDLTTLIDAYCAVWNEPDRTRRKHLLAAVWADGATYADPNVHAATADELVAHIEKVRAGRPGAQVLRCSGVDAHHQMARFAWRIVQADGTALPPGIDIAFVSDDGTKLTRIIGFFGPTKPMEA